MKYRLYVEGGGDSRREAAQFREAWAAFFEKAGLAGKKPAVVRGGGRQQTFERFKTAVANAPADELPLLLVDSEAPVQAHHTVWQHLQQRDGWNRPAGTSDDQAFLMVQVMETWFLADRSRLARFFGAGFKPAKIPAWAELEAVSKERVLDALADATRGCEPPYRKGKRSFELLAAIDPHSVAAACPHATAVLEKLRS